MASLRMLLYSPDSTAVSSANRIALLPFFLARPRRWIIDRSEPTLLYLMIRLHSAMLTPSSATEVTTSTLIRPLLKSWHIFCCSWLDWPPAAPLWLELTMKPTFWKILIKFKNELLIFFIFFYKFFTRIFINFLIFI